MSWSETQQSLSMCLEGFWAHVITHLEVRSDKAMSFEVLKITPHEQVEKKCGLQGGRKGGRKGGREERGKEGGKEDGGREGKEGWRKGKEGIISYFLCKIAPTPTSVLVESILELQHWRT